MGNSIQHCKGVKPLQITTWERSQCSWPWHSFIHPFIHTPAPPSLDLHWPDCLKLISHTSHCLTSFKLLLYICPCSNSTPNISQADSAAPPLHLHLRLCMSLFCRPFSSPSISLQAGSHLPHWSHYQLLPNRKKASLLSWGSRCLPIVVVWSDSEIYSHRPGESLCVCLYNMCLSLD